MKNGSEKKLAYLNMAPQDNKSAHKNAANSENIELISTGSESESESEEIHGADRWAGLSD